MLAHRNKLASEVRCSFRLARYLPEASPGVLRSAKISRENRFRTFVARVTSFGPAFLRRDARGAWTGRGAPAVNLSEAAS